MKEAGYETGFEVRAASARPTKSGGPRSGSHHSFLKKIGITLKTQPVERAVMSERVPGGDFQAYIWSRNRTQTR